MHLGGACPAPTGPPPAVLRSSWPAGQASALVLYTLVGLASTALVLSITVPQVGPLTWPVLRCAALRWLR